MGCTLRAGVAGHRCVKSLDPDFHLAMRYQNQLGLFFVAANWGSTLTEFDREKRERLLTRAKGLRSVAILARCKLFAPIHIRSAEEKLGPDGMTLSFKEGDLEVAEPSVESLTFEDVAGGVSLKEQKFDTRAHIEISDWELLDFAIQIVRNEVEQDGYHIKDWTSEPGPGAHITAHKDHTHTRIVVGAARYPVIDPIFDRDRLMSVAETTLIEGGKLAKASVALSHGDGAKLPLYRGEAAIATFQGLRNR